MFSMMHTVRNVCSSDVNCENIASINSDSATLELCNLE
jgi:hypothetical protein